MRYCYTGVTWCCSVVAYPHVHVRASCAQVIGRVVDAYKAVKAQTEVLIPGMAKIDDAINNVSGSLEAVERLLLQLNVTFSESESDPQKRAELADKVR